METNTKKELEGHRQRVKNKFLNSGFENWQDYEILEFALFFIVPRKDTKSIAKALIEKFGSLKELVNTDFKTLVKYIENIDGITKNAAYFFQMLKCFAIKYSDMEINKKEKLSSPNEVISFLRNRIGLMPIETMYALYLDASNKFLGFKIISEGTVGRSAVYPSEIAKGALTKNARSVIVAHNHPGGVCRASQNDIIATQAIQKALKTIEVVLLDHIIVTNSDYYSFKDNGFI